MKLTRKQLTQIKKFLKRKIVKNDMWHGLEHIEQTVKLSKAFAKKEKADINKCVIIAWLHDIAKNHEDNGYDHGNKAAEQAKTFLKKLKFQKQDIEDIYYAIQRHNKGGKKKTKESKIIWDADKLQAIGASGILRCYGYCILKDNNQEKAYKKNLKAQKFFIKRFHTKTGKKLAKQNLKFLKTFDKQYKKIKNVKL
jgi:HD superfamily phosphodiesterase